MSIVLLIEDFTIHVQIYLQYHYLIGNENKYLLEIKKNYLTVNNFFFYILFNTYKIKCTNDLIK